MKKICNKSAQQKNELQRPTKTAKPFINMQNLGRVFILLILNFYSLNGQLLPDQIVAPSVMGTTCNNSSSAYNNKYGRISYWVPASSTPVKIVKINFNIIQHTNGSGNFQNTVSEINRLNQIADWVTQIYQYNCAPSDPLPGVTPLADSKVRFEVAGIYFYPDNSLWNKTDAGTLLNAIKSVDPNRMNALNIVFSEASSGYGYASLPSTSNFNQDSYVITFGYQSYIASDYAKAQHLAHELGHCLDLLHTYAGTSCCPELCNPSDPDYLSDVFGVIPPVNCYHDAGWGCDVNDPLNTCTNNLMGGTGASCYLSPLQMGKVNRALSMSSVRRYVKCQTNSKGNINVNGNEVWDFDIKLYTGVTIKSGRQLTLKCKASFIDGKGFIVERGAKLIVDGGTITSSCNMWDGIFVWGDRTKSQNPWATNTDQGLVWVKNGALIENALDAISTIKVDAAGVADWNYTGGIVRCEGNSIFRNNRRAIQFLSFQNTHPTVPTIKLSNQSYISSCTFESTQHLNWPYTPLNYFITMYDVQGIGIVGNTFQNVGNSNLYFEDYEKGGGIKSIDARYSIAPLCLNGGCTSIQRNKFKNLWYGINAESSNSMQTISVTKTDFENCLFGVYLNSLANVTLSENSFIVGQNLATDPNHKDAYGSYFDNVPSFNFDGNTYNTAVNGEIGSIVRNSGAIENYVYNNDYNHLINACQALDNNDGGLLEDGLRINCNDFHTNDYDILEGDVGLPTTALNPNTNVGFYQGRCFPTNTPNPLLLARNTFENNCVSNNENMFYVNKTSTQPILYGRHYNSDHNPSCADQLVMVSSCGTAPQWNKTTFCPSLTNCNPPCQLANLATINASLGALKALYDGGNSATLISQINTNTVAAMKGQLTSLSPNLSDDALRAYIGKANSTTQADIGDVLVLNALVSQYVVDKINQLATAQKTYLLNRIAPYQATNYSPRGNLDAQMSQKLAEYNYAKSSLINQYLTASAYDSTGLDSAIALLNQQTTKEWRMELCQAYIAKGNGTNATAVKNELQSSYSELAQWCALQSIQITMLGYTEGAYRMTTDTTLKLQVQTIANSNDRYAALPAKAMLGKVFPAYTTEVAVAVRSANPRIANTINKTNPSYSLYPNPALQSITINGWLDKNCSIEIFNTVGQQLKQVNVASQQIEYTIDCSKLMNGLYLVKIVSSNGVNSLPFIIQK